MNPRPRAVEALPPHRRQRHRQGYPRRRHRGQRAENLQRLQAESPGTAIHLQSILPVNPEVRRFPQHYDKQSHVMNTNWLLRIVASAAGVEFVDLYSVFLDAHGRLDARYTNDGLHLNSAGYEIWVKHLKDEGQL